MKKCWCGRGCSEPDISEKPIHWKGWAVSWLLIAIVAGGLALSIARSGPISVLSLLVWLVCMFIMVLGLLVSGLTAISRI